MKRILSLDGGGIRGLIPAVILAELEAQAKKPCHEIFDMIAGTSTGGIIAVGLLAGLPAEKLVELYRDRGAEIFAHCDPLKGAVRPRYDASALESILQGLLGQTWLSETTGPELLVPCFCCDPYGVMFFKSWKSRGTKLGAGDVQDDLDFRLWQIARATSAAETYFPTANIESMSGKQFYCMDGGTAANNPAMCAWASAEELWPLEKIEILSIGTGNAAATPIDGKKSQGWGAVEWVTEGDIVNVCMDGSADVVAYQLQCLGPDSVRIQADLPATATAMDNTAPTNLAKLEAIATDLASAHSTDLARFI